MTATVVGEPVCAVCYRQTLSEDEQQRFDAERVTMPMHLCRAHQRDLDKMMTHLPKFPVYKHKKGYW